MRTVLVLYSRLNSKNSPNDNYNDYNNNDDDDDDDNNNNSNNNNNNNDFYFYQNFSLR